MKKIIILLLAALTAASLVSCGGTATDETSGTGETASDTYEDTVSEDTAAEEISDPYGGDFIIDYVYSDNGEVIAVSVNGEELSIANVLTYNAFGKVAYDTCDGVVDHEYEYDSDGNLIKQSVYWDDEWKEEGDESGLYYYYEYANDSDGNALKEQQYDSSGAEMNSTEYEYDAYGNLLKTTSKGSEGNVQFIEKYEYDSDGRRVKTLGCDQDETVIYTKTTEYDDHGNIVKETTYNDDQIQNFEVYEYEYSGDKALKKTYRSCGSSEDDVMDSGTVYYLYNGKFTLTVSDNGMNSVEEYNDNGNNIRNYRNFGG